MNTRLLNSYRPILNEALLQSDHKKGLRVNKVREISVPDFTSTGDSVYLIEIIADVIDGDWMRKEVIHFNPLTGEIFI